MSGASVQGGPSARAFGPRGGIVQMDPITELRAAVLNKVVDPILTGAA